MSFPLDLAGFEAPCVDVRQGHCSWASAPPGCEIILPREACCAILDGPMGHLPCLRHAGWERMGGACRDQGILAAPDFISCFLLFAACSGTSSKQKLPQPWHKHYSPTAAWPASSKWGHRWTGPGQHLPTGTCPRLCPHAAPGEVALPAASSMGSSPSCVPIACPWPGDAVRAWWSKDIPSRLGKPGTLCPVLAAPRPAPSAWALGRRSTCVS